MGFIFTLIICCLVVIIYQDKSFLSRALVSGPLNVTSEDYSNPPDGDEQWGYVRVRPGAHMFYWLYYTTHSAGYMQRPWIIWLQGGPGLSSTGLGNFAMFGPYDHLFQKRSLHWVQAASVVFVDNPIGAGFSYLERPANHSKNITEVTQDLVNFLRGFLIKNPQFKERPLHIFGQSYGGKMTASMAYGIVKAKEAGTLDCNLKGISIGNGWVSPVDFIQNWAPLLLHMSLVDDEGFNEINDHALKFRRATQQGYNKDTTKAWLDFAESVLKTKVDIYNILNFQQQQRKRRDTTSIRQKPYVLVGSIYELDLTEFMNTLIRRKLRIIPDSVQWDGFSEDAYIEIEKHDFLAPVIDKVDYLLQNTDVTVTVYQGQLDLVCATKGALDWVQQLNWPGLPLYKVAERKPLYDPDSGNVEMFFKAHEQLRFYWILNAGHVVPTDAPASAMRMLRRILDDVTS